MLWARLLLLVVLLGVLGIPLLTSNSYLLHIGVMIFLSTVLGASWNILGGYAGQVSFGHAAFFGVGAYTTMLLFLRLGVAPWWGMVGGAAVAAVVAVPFGFLCFRLRGPYFSLATLAVAEILRLVALNWESLTNGPVGLLITYLPSLPLPAGGAVSLERKEPFYYAGALFTLWALLATALLARSKLGYSLTAIREDEDAAESLGINTTGCKVSALVVSASLAGLAGGFYATYFRYIDPSVVFTVTLSVEMVFTAIVGGLATVFGPIVGALFLVLLAEQFRAVFAVAHLIVYGLLIMGIIRFLPTGLWGGLRRLGVSLRGMERVG